MAAGPRSEITLIAVVAVIAGLARSLLWVRIYWIGARVLRMHRETDDPVALASQLASPLQNLTRHLVLSAILDVLTLPAIFLMDTFFPFTLSSWQLGLVQMAILLFPQVFGLAALVLAYLTHQYGQWMKERGTMHQELALTI
jgi:hypothetical protein